MHRKHFIEFDGTNWKFIACEVKRWSDNLFWPFTTIFGDMREHFKFVKKILQLFLNVQIGISYQEQKQNITKIWIERGENDAQKQENLCFSPHMKSHEIEKRWKARLLHKMVFQGHNGMEQSWEDHPSLDRKCVSTTTRNQQGIVDIGSWFRQLDLDIFQQRYVVWLLLFWSKKFSYPKLKIQLPEIKFSVARTTISGCPN